MKTFTLNIFNHCIITGVVYLDFDFKIDQNKIHVKRQFPDMPSAINHLFGSMRDWLLAALQSYIAHKEIIINNGNHNEQKEALLICKNAVIDFEKKSAVTIATRFMNGLPFFNKILPNKNNDSYTSSCICLSEIELLCRRIINIKNKIDGYKNYQY